MDLFTPDHLGIWPLFYYLVNVSVVVVFIGVPAALYIQHKKHAKLNSVALNKKEDSLVASDAAYRPREDLTTPNKYNSPEEFPSKRANDDNFITSAVVAGISDSTLMGFVVGGSIGGAMVGDCLFGDDYDDYDNDDYDD